MMNVLFYFQFDTASLSIYTYYIIGISHATIATNGKRARSHKLINSFLLFFVFFLHVLTLTDTKVFCLRTLYIFARLYFRVLLSSHMLETSFVNRLAILCNNKNMKSRHRTITIRFYVMDDSVL